MKLHKIFLFAAVALATMFTSCSSDDDYEPGKPAGSYDVGFAVEDPVVLQLGENNFTVTVARNSTSSQLTVPIEVISADGFTVPESVTFNSGSAAASFEVTVPSGMEACKSYDFIIRVPEEYTNPYDEDAYSPIYKVTVTQEDYKEYQTCMFQDNFWYGDSWSVTVEYSETMDLYRIKDLYTTGYPLYFKWEASKGTVTTVASDGTVPAAWYTGLSDDDYPAYYVTPSKSDCYYDDENKCIVFDWWWRVSAGSYGTGYPGYLFIE